MILCASSTPELGVTMRTHQPLLVPESVQGATSARAKKSPNPGEHVHFFRMKRDRSKGFYSEKCPAEVSIVLCFEWDGCLVPRDVFRPFHSIVACGEHCVQ